MTKGIPRNEVLQPMNDGAPEGAKKAAQQLRQLNEKVAPDVHKLAVQEASDLFASDYQKEVTLADTVASTNPDYERYLQSVVKRNPKITGNIDPYHTIA